MDTLVLKDNIQDFEVAADILENDGIVVFPTETVYGIGALASSDLAVQKIFIAKNRPLDNPLIFHISDLSLLNELVEDISLEAETLISSFWPGPLTLIFRKKKGVYDYATCGLDTIAVRMPDSFVVNNLLKRVDFPIVAPSANLSGKPSGTRFVDVYADFNGRVDAIFDVDIVDLGLESTVIDVSSDNITLMRPGSLSLETIQKKCSDIKIHELKIKNNIQKIISPGVKYTHYKPNASVIVFSGKSKVESKQKFLNEKIKSGHQIISLEYSSIEEMAKNLYADFRKADRDNIEYVLIESVDDTGIGKAINNRLYKASSKIISSE